MSASTRQLLKGKPHDHVVLIVGTSSICDKDLDTRVSEAATRGVPMSSQTRHPLSMHTVEWSPRTTMHVTWENVDRPELSG